MAGDKIALSIEMSDEPAARPFLRQEMAFRLAEFGPLDGPVRVRIVLYRGGDWPRLDDLTRYVIEALARTTLSTEDQLVELSSAVKPQVAQHRLAVTITIKPCNNEKSQ